MVHFSQAAISYDEYAAKPARKSASARDPYCTFTERWWQKNPKKRNKYVLVLGLYHKTRAAAFTKGEVALAKAMGCDGIIRMNIADLCAASLDELLTDANEPCSEYNVDYIWMFAGAAAAVLVRRTEVPMPLQSLVWNVMADIRSAEDHMPMIDVFGDDDKIDPALLDGAVLTSQMAIPAYRP